MAIAGEEIQTLSMDQHGLVAAVCKDFGIAEKINSRIGKADERRVVKIDQASWHPKSVQGGSLI